MDKKLSSLRSLRYGEREIKSLSPFSSRLRRLVVKTLFRVRLQYRQLRRLETKRWGNGIDVFSCAH